MLVLTRRIGESIVIGLSEVVGEDVTITLVDVERGTARLGIAAPDDIPVHRAEIQVKLTAQGRRHIADNRRAGRKAAPACGDLPELV